MSSRKQEGQALGHREAEEWVWIRVPPKQGIEGGHHHGFSHEGRIWECATKEKTMLLLKRPNFCPFCGEAL